MVKLLLLLIFMTSGCQSVKKFSREEFQAHMNASPIHKQEYWQEWMSLPLEKRVIPATPEMVRFLGDDNLYNGFPGVPKEAALTDDHLKTINEAIGGLPHWIKKAIEKNITGIMIIEDLGSSAMTDAVRGFKNKGFIVFDIKTLTKTANEWCTWKEASPFKKGDYEIKCTLEEEKNDDPISAFRYIFLHEAAHILNMSSDLTPFWNNESKKKPSDTEKYDFLKLDWKFNEKGRIVRLQDSAILGKVTFYKPKYAKENSSMLAHYEALKKSNFATLYGATNVWDDLAEGYANYIHSQILKKPFKIEIFKDKKKLLTYTNCWQENRCRNKRKLIEKFIRN